MTAGTYSLPALPPVHKVAAEHVSSDILVKRLVKKHDIKQYITLLITYTCFVLKTLSMVIRQKKLLAGRFFHLLVPATVAG